MAKTFTANRRQREILKPKKTRGLNIASTILLWLSLGLIVYFVDPSTSGVIPFFFFLFSLCIFTTTSLLLTNFRRKLLLTSFLTLFLILKYLNIANIVNLILLAAIGLTYELYSQKSN